VRENNEVGSIINDNKITQTALLTCKTMTETELLKLLTDNPTEEEPNHQYSVPELVQSAVASM
jgi:hypothetical protein